MSAWEARQVCREEATAAIGYPGSGTVGPYAVEVLAVAGAFGIGTERAWRTVADGKPVRVWIDPWGEIGYLPPRNRTRGRMVEDAEHVRLTAPDGTVVWDGPARYAAVLAALADGEVTP